MDHRVYRIDSVKVLGYETGMDVKICYMRHPDDERKLKQRRELKTLMRSNPEREQENKRDSHISLFFAWQNPDNFG